MLFMPACPPYGSASASIVYKASVVSRAVGRGRAWHQSPLQLIGCRFLSQPQSDRATVKAAAAVGQVMTEYMACLKRHGTVAEQCRPLARKYLECRMERCTRPPSPGRAPARTAISGCCYVFSW